MGRQIPSALCEIRLHIETPILSLALASLTLDRWDWASAEREYKRAIELNPNLAKAHGGYSRYLSVMGRHEQAIAEIKRTRELDPLTPIASTALAQRLRWARQYDQSMEA
ncbi:MAG TPA: tetratricopeptide repeat protein [Pyrinomonadaceae bacterium]|nr:tetratricopeptide repeat protein [Pyrinomonadaceae bacterium]